MKGKFPNKLFNITLTGRALKEINPDILRVRISNKLSFAENSPSRSIRNAPYGVLRKCLIVSNPQLDIA